MMRESKEFPSTGNESIRQPVTLITMSNNNDMPARTAPVTEIFDWHYARSINEGIDPYDAEILAEGFVTRYAR